MPGARRFGRSTISSRWSFKRPRAPLIHGEPLEMVLVRACATGGCLKRISEAGWRRCCNSADYPPSFRIVIPTKSAAGNASAPPLPEPWSAVPRYWSLMKLPVRWMWRCSSRLWSFWQDCKKIGGYRIFLSAIIWLWCRCSATGYLYSTTEKSSSRGLQMRSSWPLSPSIPAVWWRLFSSR